MKIIVDTNILFSALLAINSDYRKTLLNKEIEFYAPNFIFVELFKYKEKIAKYTKLNETELLDFLHKLVDEIRFVNPLLITIENRKQAYELCKDIDLKDLPFVALALEFSGKLWTGDKKLKRGLKDKGFADFFELS